LGVKYEKKGNFYFMFDSNIVVIIFSFFNISVIKLISNDNGFDKYTELSLGEMQLVMFQFVDYQ